MSGVTRRTSVRRDYNHTVRPWRVDLYDASGYSHRTRWFRRHVRALRWAVKRAYR